MENNKPPRKSLKRRRKAIRAFKKGYKDLGKVKSGEYDREKREFFFDGKDVSLMPTNDADVPITKGIKKRNQGQNFRQMDDNKKEVRRENKQVRSLKRLRTLKSKGKIGTNRYKKLREKVYNPFPDKSPLKKGHTDPTEGVKKGVNKSVLKPTLESVIKKNPSPTTGGQSIEMTGHPGEYLMGGGAIGGFKTAKTIIGKAMQAGQRYAVQSAKKSFKPSSIGSNSL